MPGLKEIFTSYSRDIRDFKKFILSLSSIVLENIDLKDYFLGYGILEQDIECGYNFDDRKILLNPGFIIDTALERANLENISEEDRYPFLCAYTSESLLNLFGLARNFKLIENNDNSLLADVLNVENYNLTSMNVHPLIMNWYLNFHEENRIFLPFMRTASYLALKNTLMMVKDTSYEKIAKFFQDEFVQVLISPYISGLAPLEIVRRNFEEVVFSNNEEENKRIKRCFLDFERLPFYDEDEEIMRENMLLYPLEERFKLGMYVSSDEIDTITRKLVL